MLQSAQRYNMLRLIIQTKRRYKKIVKHKVKTRGAPTTRAKTDKSSIYHKDQDSDVSFESDNDEEIDTTEIEEEDWVEYI